MGNCFHETGIREDTSCAITDREKLLEICSLVGSLKERFRAHLAAVCGAGTLSAAMIATFACDVHANQLEKFLALLVNVEGILVSIYYGEGIMGIRNKIRSVSGYIEEYKKQNPVFDTGTAIIESGSGIPLYPVHNHEVRRGPFFHSAGLFQAKEKEEEM